VDVNHRFARGFQLRGVYTFSKSLDDGSAWNTSVDANAPGFVMFPLNPKLDCGLSTADVPQLLVINGSYDLPFGKDLKGWRGKAVSGWTISAIETAQSRFPFTPQLGFNPSNNGRQPQSGPAVYQSGVHWRRLLGSPNLQNWTSPF
jgi:hypothetical protein